MRKILKILQNRIVETFQSLDKNDHGYLTLREFINGFHTFFDLEEENQFMDEVWKLTTNLFTFIYF